MRIRSGRDSGELASRHGQALAAIGGGALLASLWLPWYTARAPQSAWQTFTAMPTVLLVTGAFVGVLSVLELCARAGDTSRLAMLAGGLAAILVAYRLSVPPLAGMHSGWGAYVALASSLTVLGGGMLAATDPSLPEIPVPSINLGQASAPGLSSPPAP
jgi:energy-converting hydrogenase Eha subunit A